MSTKQPYKGLRPYQENDQDNFFGRDAARKILIGKILTNKLTLLFAATGVGKTSLLQAAVIPKLKKTTGEHLDVVYHNSWWGDSPVAKLKKSIIEQLKKLGKLTVEVPQSKIDNFSLKEFWQFCALFTRQPLVVILDQFEEFFQYQQRNANFKPFIKQLAETVTDREVPIVLVISMREDFALELNAFKPYLPTILFENFYRLERLTEEEAKIAVVAPVENIGFRYEDALLKKLFQDLTSRELQRDTKIAVPNLQNVIEPPYLQIVCFRLWELEQNNPTQTIRLETYQNHGGATKLLKNHVENIIGKFTPPQKVIASQAFEHLVTLRGTKIVHSFEGLAKKLSIENSEENINTLRQVLKKLSAPEARILRSQEQAGVKWYELYHDMFSDSIEDWNKAYKDEQRKQRIRKRTFQLVGGGIFVIGLLYAAYDGVINYTSHHLRLSAKTGVSDAIEVYQGKFGSRDFLGLQKYLGETGYQRTQIEPDKLFTEKSVGDFNALNVELIGHLPLVERIEAYLDTGKIAKAFKLAEKSIYSADNQRATKVINNLAKFRSPKSINIFTEFLKNSDNSYLKGKVITALGTINLPESVNALLVALNEKDEKLRDSAIQNLHRLDEITVLESLMAKDKNSNTHYALEKILSELENPKTIELLIPLLQNENTGVRTQAVNALGRLGNSKQVEPLIPMLQDENVGVRKAVVKALRKFGYSAPLMRSLKNEENAEVRDEIVKVLNSFINNDTTKLLIQQLKEKNAEVRANAINALTDWEINAFKQIEPLIFLLKHENEDMRKNAVSILGNFCVFEGVEILMSLSKDENTEVQSNAIKVLERFGVFNASKPLVYLLKSQDKKIRQNAVKALIRFGDSLAFEPLISLLQEKRTDIQKGAIEVLSQLGDSTLVEPLVLLQFKGENAEVQGSAKLVLSNLLETKKIEPSQTVEPLISLLQDEDAKVRNEAVQALEHLGDSKVVEHLIVLLKDEVEEVRNSVAQALGNLGDTVAVKPLILALQDRIPEIRYHAAKTLGRLQDSRAVEPLIALLLKEKNATVQYSAVEALVHLGNVKAIPPLIVAIYQSIKTPDNPFSTEIDERLLDTFLPKFDSNLLMFLLQEENPQVRLYVATMLGNLDESHAIESLISLLRNESATVRNSAVKALGKLEQFKHVESLIPLLQDENLAVRQSTITVLSNLGDAKAVIPLIPLLQDEETEVRNTVVKALGKLEQFKHVESLIPLLQDENLAVRQNTITVLGNLGNAKAVKALIPLLRDENAEIRKNTVTVLGKLSDTIAVEPLISLIQDEYENAEIRQSAIKVLGDLGDSQAIQPLIALLEKENVDLPKRVIVKALAKANFSDAQVIEPLISLLDKGNEKIRNTYYLNDYQTIDENISWLKELTLNLEEKFWFSNQDILFSNYEIAKILTHLGDAKALRSLILATQYQRIIEVAINKEYKRSEKPPSEKPPFFVPFISYQQLLDTFIKQLGYSSLIPLLQDKNATVRNYTVKALGNLGDSNAIEPLMPLLEDKNEEVQYQVAKALVSLGDTRGVLPLINAVKIVIETDYIGAIVNEETVQRVEIKFLEFLINKFGFSPFTALPKHENPEVRNTVAKTLARLKHYSKTTEIFALLLKDRDANIRLKILEILSDFKDLRIIKPLTSLLKDENKRVRLKTIAVLGKLGDLKIVEDLVPLLEEDDWKIRFATIDALSHLGNLKTVEHLMPLLKSEDKRYTAEILSRWNIAETFDLLVPSLKNPSVFKRNNGIKSLAHFGSSKSINSFLKLLTDEDNVSINVANALCQLAITETVKPLITPSKWQNYSEAYHKAANQSKWQNYSEAYHKAANQLKPLEKTFKKPVENTLKKTDTVDVLINKLKNRKKYVRLYATKVLGKLDDPKALEPLIAMLKDEQEEEEVVHSAAKALGKLEHPKAFELLIEMLKEESGYVRSNAVYALGQWNDNQAVEPVIEMLKDEDKLVRSQAAYALGQLGDSKAIEPLIDTLKEESESVRLSAIEVLGKLGNPKAIEPLIEALKDESQSVRRRAIQVLGKLGHSKAIEPLIEAVKDESQSVRLSAIEALGKLGNEKKTLTFLTNLTKSDQIEDRKNLAQALGNFSVNPSIQVLVTLLDDHNLEVRLQAIKSLEKLEAISILHNLLVKSTNANIQKVTFEALAKINSPDSIPILSAAISNPNITISVRFMALTALQNLVDKDTLIAIISEVVKKPQNEMVLGIRIYNLLGKLKARQALPLLHNRLKKLEQQAHRWRAIRDQERQDFTEKESKTWQQKLDKAKPTFHWGFELGYAIAQIAPNDAGVKLLSHNLANVRYGAWLGLGQVGTVALVQRLDKARMTSDNPLFRHAAYRAIDYMLNRLEVTGGKPELKALKDWLPKVVDQEGVKTRVEWTIQQLGRSMDILAEFPQLRDKEDIHIQMAQKVRELVCNDIERTQQEKLEKFERRELARKKRKELYKNFKRGVVIRDEDVPPGMRVVRTPFGDRLVPIR